MENLLEARIYVGTYAKYNDGSLFGEWMDLPGYSDIEEFYEACKALHDDEEDPEFMFQDWENIPSELINESWLSQNFFEICEAISGLDETQQEAFNAWCDITSSDMENEDIRDLINSFEDECQGQYKDEEDFAYDLVEDCYDLSDFVKSYFDYEKFARDLFMTDYTFEEGFVFRRN